MTPGPIKRVVVTDKVALIRRLLDGIATLPLDSLRAFRSDPRMVAAAESYLRRALEALLDIARHVLAKAFGRGATEYTEVARQLGEVGVVSRDQAERLVLRDAADVRHPGDVTHQVQQCVVATALQGFLD